MVYNLPYWEKALGKIDPKLSRPLKDLVHDLVDWLVSSVGKRSGLTIAVPEQLNYTLDAMTKVAIGILTNLSEDQMPIVKLGLSLVGQPLLRFLRSPGFE